MGTKKKIEIFSAGCPACQETIELVRHIAGSRHEIAVRDMNQSDNASAAKNCGVSSVPAVLIDGKLADCCSGRGPDESVLRSAIG